jgi:hypothetical protein
MFTRLTGWLAARGIERRIALVVFLAALPSVAMGLDCDDYGAAARVERNVFAAYAFTPTDPEAAHAWMLDQRSTGIAPWWVSEQLRASFFRPLASLSLWVDFASGAPVWWMHLENCVIYALTVWLAARTYRQLGLSGAALGWASVFLGLDGVVAASVGWIAARNTLLAPLFGLACILLHDRASREGRLVVAALASFAFVLSVLSAELGLCTLGYLGAHALTVDRRSAMRRAWALVPYALVAATHLGVYVHGGYGTHDVGVYRDVFHAPLSAFAAFTESIPIWLASLATIPVAGLSPMLPELRLPFLVVSMLVLVVLVPLLWTRRETQPAWRTFALGTLLSLVPLASVVPMERIRFFAAFGMCGLLGPFVVRDVDAHERTRRWVARALGVVHGVLLPLLFVPTLFSARSIDGAAVTLERALPHASSPIAIALNPPMYATTQWATEMRAHEGERGPPVIGLYAGTEPVAISRLDDRTLELSVMRSWCPTTMERVRDFSAAPLHVGDRISLAHLVVEVREVEAGGVPTRARFTFAQALESSQLSFWRWDGSNVERWTPLPIGARETLPRASLF